MASPIGHSLAGIALWGLARGRGPAGGKSEGALRMLAAFVAVSTLPDLDFVGLYAGLMQHRTMSHSLVFAGGVCGIVWLMRRGGIRTGIGAGWAAACLLCHYCIDFVTQDFGAPYGLQLLWPFSGAYFLAPLTPIPGMHREAELLLSDDNVRAVVFETVFFGLTAVLVSIIARRHRRRGAVDASSRACSKESMN